jgi:hypothetical protein
VFAPATIATESALTFTTAAAGPAVVVTCKFADDTPTIPPVSVDVRAVSLSVHVTDATPDASVTLVGALTVPPPVDTVQVTVTPGAG